MHDRFGGLAERAACDGVWMNRAAGIRRRPQGHSAATTSCRLRPGEGLRSWRIDLGGHGMNSTWRPVTIPLVFPRFGAGTERVYSRRRLVRAGAPTRFATVTLGRGEHKVLEAQTMEPADQDPRHP